MYSLHFFEHSLDAKPSTRTTPRDQASVARARRPLEVAARRRVATTAGLAKRLRCAEPARPPGARQRARRPSADLLPPPAPRPASASSNRDSPPSEKMRLKNQVAAPRACWAPHTPHPPAVRALAAARPRGGHWAALVPQPGHLPSPEWVLVGGSPPKPPSPSPAPLAGRDSQGPSPLPVGQLWPRSLRLRLPDFRGPGGDNRNAGQQHVHRPALQPGEPAPRATPLCISP